MKMNSLLKSKPKNNIRKVVIIILLCCAGLGGIQFVFPRALTTTVLILAKPLWVIRDGISRSTSGFFGHFERVKTLQKENDALREELYVLKVKEYQFDHALIEYADLKTLMNASSSKSSSAVIARVISKPPFTPYDTFVVDKGSEDGVLMGDLVYANDALVIGRVHQVTQHNAYVTLFSSGDQTQEFVVSRTGVSVATTGMGGGNFALYVPKDFDIVVGDTLSEPSYDSGIVATVYALDETSQNSFKRVYARVPKAIFQSKFVRIGNL